MMPLTNNSTKQYGDKLIAAWEAHLTELQNNGDHPAGASGAISAAFADKVLLSLINSDESLRSNWLNDIVPTSMKSGVNFDHHEDGIEVHEKFKGFDLKSDFFNDDPSTLPESQLMQSPKPHPSIKGSGLDADGVPCLFSYDFFNWGATVKNNQKIAFFPRSIKGIQEIVQWATSKNLRVRCSGYRHTWSNVFGDQDQILISFVFPRNLGPPTFMESVNPLNELHIIENVDPERYGPGCIKLGAAVTNEMLRKYCVEHSEWTIPFNVIMVEISIGGSNAPICHGSGITSKTLSDLVVAMEIVNVHGNIMVIDDPEHLKAAAGCFGILGPVVSLILKFDPMSIAQIKPKIVPRAQAVPRETNGPAWDTFIQDCGKYYSEWFWFAYQDDCWVNCWDKHDIQSVSTHLIEDFPGKSSSIKLNVAEYAMELGNRTLFKCLPGRLQGQLIGKAAMKFVPNREIYTHLPNAIHFQRGINNARVNDMEFEIRIPSKKDNPNEADFSICSKVWWAVIDAAETFPGDPLRVALEMRITGDSNILLAPQLGNTLGTCSIEFLTTPNVDSSLWNAFRQEILNRWVAIAEEYNVPIRPHWAKEWMGLMMYSSLEKKLVPIEMHLKNELSPQLEDFAATINKIGANQERKTFTMDDCLSQFSNEFLRWFFTPSTKQWPIKSPMKLSAATRKETIQVHVREHTRPVLLKVSLLVDNVEKHVFTRKCTSNAPVSLCIPAENRHQMVVKIAHPGKYAWNEEEILFKQEFALAASVAISVKDRPDGTTHAVVLPHVSEEESDAQSSPKWKTILRKLASPFSGCFGGRTSY